MIKGGGGLRRGPGRRTLGEYQGGPPPDPVDENLLTESDEIITTEADLPLTTE